MTHRGVGLNPVVLKLPRHNDNDVTQTLLLREGLLKFLPCESVEHSKQDLDAALETLRLRFGAEHEVWVHFLRV